MTNVDFCRQAWDLRLQKGVALGVFPFLQRGVLRAVRKGLQNKPFRYSQNARSLFFDAKVALRTAEYAWIPGNMHSSRLLMSYYCVRVCKIRCKIRERHCLNSSFVAALSPWHRFAV